jgi:hypothetical protein
MGDTITLLLCDEGLCIQQNGQPSQGFACRFSDNCNFSIQEVPNALFKALYNAAGKVEALELKQGGMTLKLPRME